MAMVRLSLLLSMMFLAGAALAQAPAAQPATLADLDALGKPVVLSGEELTALLPGARMNRVVASGNKHEWTNLPDGTLYLVSDNAFTSSRRLATTSPGKWNISPDGRYCMFIEYGGREPEKWCRYVVRVGDDYYGVGSTGNPAARVFKMGIRK